MNEWGCQGCQAPWQVAESEAKTPTACRLAMDTNPWRLRDNGGNRLGRHPGKVHLSKGKRALNCLATSMLKPLPAFAPLGYYALKNYPGRIQKQFGSARHSTFGITPFE